MSTSLLPAKTNDLQRWLDVSLILEEYTDSNTVGLKQTK